MVEDHLLGPRQLDRQGNVRLVGFDCELDLGDAAVKPWRAAGFPLELKAGGQGECEKGSVGRLAGGFLLADEANDGARFLGWACGLEPQKQGDGNNEYDAGAQEPTYHSLAQPGPESSGNQGKGKGDRDGKKIEELMRRGPECKIGCERQQESEMRYRPSLDPSRANKRKGNKKSQGPGYQQRAPDDKPGIEKLLAQDSARDSGTLFRWR